MQEKCIIKKPTPRKAETTKLETKKPLKAKTVSSDASPRKNQKKKGPSPTPKGGRPPRFPTGTTNMRIPNELAEHLQNAIRAIYPNPQDGVMDKDKADRLTQVLKEFYLD